jgi:hypothetical protein
MDSASNTTRDLAMLFLDYKGIKNLSRTELMTVVQEAFERLRIHLSRPIGAAGYRALLIRSIALSTSKSGWLEAIQIEKDGTLAGFTEAAASQSLSSVIEGSVEMVTCLIGLLETFVGRELSLRLIGDVWPIPVKEMGTKEDSNG